MTETPRTERWGWTFDEEQIGGLADSLWEAIEAGVEHSCDDAASLLVGKVIVRKPSDYIDEDTFDQLCPVVNDDDSEVVYGWALTEHVGDLHGEHVWDGCANSDEDFDKTKLTGLSFEQIRMLADKHIELDPDEVLYSSRAFPIELRNGQWTTTQEKTAEPNECDEPEACIVYVSKPHPETGDEGWCFIAPGHVRYSATLKAAMEMAQQVAETVKS
jgi:hypothetical protein